MKMNKTETVHFMQKIKAYYPSFTMEDFKINEWYDRLKPYDVADAYYRFDQHLQGEKQDYEPKLHYITKFLKTPSEKANETTTGNYIVQCKLCGEWMTLSEHDKKHYPKCLSIKYLQRILEKRGTKVEYEELDALDENKFNAIYNKYMEVDEYAKEYYNQVSNKKISTERNTNNVY